MVVLSLIGCCYFPNSLSLTPHPTDIWALALFWGILWVLWRVLWASQGGTSSKEPACQCWRHQRHGFHLMGSVLFRRAWQPTSVFLPGKFHGQRSLVGLQCIGSQRVGHDWSDLAHAHGLGKMAEATVFSRIPAWPKGHSHNIFLLHRGGIAESTPITISYGSTRAAPPSPSNSFSHSGVRPALSWTNSVISQGSSRGWTDRMLICTSLERDTQGGGGF